MVGLEIAFHFQGSEKSRLYGVIVKMNIELGLLSFGFKFRISLYQPARQKRNNLVPLQR